MPAIVHYRPGFPSSSRPVKTSASIADDGLVTAEALFLSAGYNINQPISPSLFSALSGVQLQGLFVESVSTEKNNGLLFFRVRAVGAINPPVLLVRREVSPRSFSKSVTEDEITTTFSFDYLSETISVSSTIVASAISPIADQYPEALQIYNRTGSGDIVSSSVLGQDVGTPVNIRGRVQAYPRVLTSQSLAIRSGISQVVKTFQLIYE